MRIKIHLITEIYLIIALFSGLFYDVMALYLCLIVHELGHLLMIKLFKKKVILLEISPLGGILHIDKCQNDFNHKEFLIYISGPVASLGLYYLFTTLGVHELLIRSAFYVLILNLLPILPLDGAKIIMSLKQYLLPFRKVLKFTTVLSLVVCSVLLVYFVNKINYVVILMFFIYLNLLFYNDIPYHYFSFLWYKYLYPNHKLKNKVIVADKNIYHLFYKGFNHLFYKNKQFITEKDMLKEVLNTK